jgi:catalase
MTYHVDGVEAGGNPHVNYEPTARGGPLEAEPAGVPHTPFVAGHIVRQSIGRVNDYGQAGERYRAFTDGERAELVKNLVDQLTPCDDDIRERMILHLSMCDAEYGRRVADGLAMVPRAISKRGSPPSRPVTMASGDAL